MLRFIPTFLALGLACTAALAAPMSSSAFPAKATLKAFESEAEFQSLMERWREQARQRSQLARRESGVADLALSMAPAAPMAKAAESESKANAADSGNAITNVQTAGVDEGGIVKRAGDHLVILRRGRLFTVRVGGDELRPVASIDAYAPGSDPSGAWYDEMLIHERTVVVIGYSYARGGTEVGLFELGQDGSLVYRATHHLRSHDYYSSRNYASRLIGNRLVFYAPMSIHPHISDTASYMPQWRRWHPAATPQEWKRILPATRIFRSDDETDPFQGATLHTVTSCELQRAEMNCEASAVLGPRGRVFYVSADNVYVWTTEPRRNNAWGGADPMARATVFRLPLGGAAPSALKTTGSPIDQLSFLEDASGHLNVLLRAQARGEGMWSAEQGRGDFALMRVPLTSFGQGRDAAPRSAYRPLAGIEGQAIQNRYVGDWLLVGATGVPKIHALRVNDGDTELQTTALSHGVERIEALGAHALVVGASGRDLHFSSLRLDARQASLAGKVMQADAAQSETRTHGFFYKPTSRDEGLLGLPIVGPGPQLRSPHSKLMPGHGSAAVSFMRNRDLDLSAIGKLSANSVGALANDGCKASCVDWYGNARPIFLGDRILALMGYELVEGRMVGGTFRAEGVEERRRIDYSPRAASRWGRED
jgi:Beta propeller domain